MPSAMELPAPIYRRSPAHGYYDGHGSSDISTTHLLLRQQIPRRAGATGSARMNYSVIFAIPTAFHRGRGASPHTVLHVKRPAVLGEPPARANA